jgi:hypothetical protein
MVQPHFRFDLRQISVPVRAALTGSSAGALPARWRAVWARCGLALLAGSSGFALDGPSAMK